MPDTRHLQGQFAEVRVVAHTHDRKLKAIRIQCYPPMPCCPRRLVTGVADHPDNTLIPIAIWICKMPGLVAQGPVNNDLALRDFLNGLFLGTFRENWMRHRMATNLATGVNPFSHIFP